MSDGTVEHIPLSSELLALMRFAAHTATTLHEPFITVRALLVALLEDDRIGAALQEAIPREKLYDYAIDAGAAVRMTASRVAETSLDSGERSAMLRFNTLAFKVPDGSRSVWLSREAHSAFVSGAQRVPEGDAYAPVHLAQGIAADAIRAPGLLSALHIEPGVVTDAIMKL